MENSRGDHTTTLKKLFNCVTMNEFDEMAFPSTWPPFHTQALTIIYNIFHDYTSGVADLLPW